MKKQIFSLILSASILTASPLFAMEDPENDPHKTATKRAAPIDSNKHSELQPKKQRAMTSLKKIKRLRESGLSVLLQTIHISPEEDEKINGTGDFQRFGQTPILEVLRYLPINDVLKMFQLSKTMYKSCNQDAVWELLAKKHDACISTIRFRHPKDIKIGLREWLHLRKHNMTYAEVNSWNHH